MSMTQIARAREISAEIRAGERPEDCPYETPELVRAWLLGRASILLDSLADALERAERASFVVDRTAADITRRLAGLADGLANSNSSAEDEATYLAEKARAWVRAQDGGR